MKPNVWGSETFKTHFEVQKNSLEWQPIESLQHFFAHILNLETFKVNYPYYGYWNLVKDGLIIIKHDIYIHIYEKQCRK